MKHGFLAFWPTGAWAALAACLLGLAGLAVPFFQAPVELSYELPFLFRPDIPVEGVAVIYMDEASEQRLQQDRWSRWDRSLHARLLTILGRAHVKAVVFDVLFQGGTNSEADQALARAAKRQGKVVVAGKVAPKLHEGETIGESLERPYEALAQAATWGVVESSGANKTVREHYRASRYQVPSLAWRVAELTMPPPLPDPFEARWVNYYGPSGKFPHYSYADVLETNFNALGIFSNQVVFVGAAWSVGFTGGVGTDDFRTPYTRLTDQRLPGVDINATTYLNLIRRDWLSRLPPPLETMAILSLGLVAGFGLAPWRPASAALVAALLAALICSAGCLLMWQTRVWFPWLLVAGVQIPGALLCTALAHTRRLQHEKRALEQALVITQAGASPAEAMHRATLLSPDPTPLHPVSMGSSARDSGPSAAVADLVQAPPHPDRPSVPDHVLVKSIGKGAYGEVWLARDIIGTYHAVKIIFRRAFHEAEPFEREFNGIRRFTPISRSHPGFVHILHVGRNEQQDYLYYIMELGDDERDTTPLNPETYRPKNLAGELERRRRLPLPECLQLGLQLCDALGYLHRQGLIHRDIKPSNVIFVKGAPKFADIGLVTEIATAGREVTYLGTKGYIAPEGPGTPSADVYSLGKVIYQAGFGVDIGRYPELPTEVVESADETALFELNRIVLRACDANATQRYQSALELARALASLKRHLDRTS